MITVKISIYVKDGKAIGECAVYDGLSVSFPEKFTFDGVNKIPQILKELMAQELEEKDKDSLETYTRKMQLDKDVHHMTTDYTRHSITTTVYRNVYNVESGRWEQEVISKEFPV